ncbi:hypothetical protein BDZ97DRAFT_1751507 [Flammula alnicola]|nr:hypothetical protein BDZ97DRAFT_1751507 [Flammula alnicola]
MSIRSNPGGPGGPFGVLLDSGWTPGGFRIIIWLCCHQKKSDCTPDGLRESGRTPLDSTRNMWGRSQDSGSSPIENFRHSPMTRHIPALVPDSLSSLLAMDTSHSLICSDNIKLTLIGALGLHMESPEFVRTPSGLLVEFSIKFGRAVSQKKSTHGLHMDYSTLPESIRSPPGIVLCCPPPIPVGMTGIQWNGTGIQWNGTRIQWNKTGMSIKEKNARRPHSTGIQWNGGGMGLNRGLKKAVQFNNNNTLLYTSSYCF